MPRLSPVASGLLAVALSLSSTSLVSAQHAGWQEGQVNASICQWQQPRAAVVKDTVYIDGGYLWWIPGMEDGSYGVPTQDGKWSKCCIRNWRC